MAEVMDDTQALESTTVGIYRTATVVKGGRRFSFAALVAVGDRRGNVGIGYGKAPGVPAAIEKAQKDARKHLAHIALHDGTLPHPVQGRHGASRVLLQPAAPGTGVIASGTVRAVLEMAGVQDCLTKCYGSTNKKNVCKAVMEGLGRLRRKEAVAEQRGVTIEKTEVEQRIETAQRFMVETVGEEAAEAATPAGGSETPGQDAGETGGGGAGGAAARPATEPAASGAATAPEAPADESSESGEAGEASDPEQRSGEGTG